MNGYIPYCIRTLLSQHNNRSKAIPSVDAASAIRDSFQKSSPATFLPPINSIILLITEICSLKIEKFTNHLPLQSLSSNALK